MHLKAYVSGMLGELSGIKMALKASLSWDRPALACISKVEWVSKCYPDATQLPTDSRKLTQITGRQIWGLTLNLGRDCSGWWQALLRHDLTVHLHQYHPPLPASLRSLLPDTVPIFKKPWHSNFSGLALSYFLTPMYMNIVNIRVCSPMHRLLLVYPRDSAGKPGDAKSQIPPCFSLGL